MFDLEHSIAEWRRQMLAAGIESSAPLEELEAHLREDITQRMKSGSDASQAFDAASKSFGQPYELKREFQRAGEPLEARLVKLIGIGCGTVAFLFMLWTLFILFLCEAAWTAKLAGLGGVAAAVLTWKYNHGFLPAIRNQELRAVIGLACCVGSLLWIKYFIANFLPQLIIKRWGLPNGLLLAEFLWSWTIMAILGGVGHGLEKAATRQDSTADA